MKDRIERAPHIGKYAPKHLTVVPHYVSAEERHALRGDEARREREARSPMYMQLIDDAIARARGR